MRDMNCGCFIITLGMLVGATVSLVMIFSYDWQIGVLAVLTIIGGYVVLELTCSSFSVGDAVDWIKGRR